jgi:two-component system, cell cycle response regulator CtrA
MRVLLIQDDPAVIKSAEHCLQSNGFTSILADSWDEGKSLALHYDHDLIVLDSLISGRSGYLLMKCLRLRRITTPFVVLSSHGDRLEETLKSFSHGADDYVRTPFESDELAARMLAVVRRSKGHAHSIIKIGRLCINLSTRKASVLGKTVSFSPSEFKLLSCMCLRPGCIIAKDTLLDHLYVSKDDDASEKVVDVFIYRIRAKLRPFGLEMIMQTVQGHGYMLEPIEEPAS